MVSFMLRTARRDGGTAVEQGADFDPKAPRKDLDRDSPASQDFNNKTFGISDAQREPNNAEK